MTAWAKPGVKCVCIDSDPNPYFGKSHLVKGEVYTIHSVTPPSFYGSRWGVFLVEIPCLASDGFLLSRFRPLISQADDVAMFRAIADRGLAQNSIHVSEPA